MDIRTTEKVIIDYNPSEDFWNFRSGQEEIKEIVGKNLGLVINLGAKLRVKVLNADLVKRKLDFSLVEVLEN